MHHPRRSALGPAAHRAACLCLLAALLFAVFAPPAAAQRYRNVVNDRFATVSDGPQSSLIVDVPAGGTEAAVRASVQRSVRADWSARARALAPQVAQMRRTRLLKARGVFPVSTLVTVRQSGRLVIPPRRTRAFGNGTLTFTYTGWSPREEAALRQFQDAFYPRIQNLYGAPAWSGNVEVVNLGPLDGGQATDVQRLAFGAYDVSGGRILLPSFENAQSQAQAFLLLMVHAFHGPTVFAYDAWEQGFARAVASLVARDATLGFEDASANNLYSLLKFYDLLNQPPLGNPTFFPPSQANLPLEGRFTIAKMIAPRLGMSGAAWLKVAIENPLFFRQFNEAYYGQFDVQPGLAGNVPALRGVAANFLPGGVEGLAWNDWYPRQYILDTSVAPGNKLYAFVVPSEVSGEDGQSAFVALIYFRTLANGDETLLNGRAYATYFDATGARVNLGTASEQATLSEGEGFITTLAFPTPGFDAGRITMDFHAGNETARTYLPSGFSGDFQGVILGVTSGTVIVRQPALGRSRQATIENGAFGVPLGVGANDLAVTEIVVTNADGNTTTTHRVNAGDGLYYALVRVAGAARTVTKTFAASTVPYLISLPVRPLQPDIAGALGLSPADFLLSSWNPLTPGYQTFAPGQASVAPLQPGRGYWLKIAPAGATQATVNVTGYDLPRDTDLTVSLPYGWNLIGTPWPEGTNVADLQVQFLQNDTVTWDSAVAQNLVAADAFGYNPQTGVYEVAPTLSGDWKGYWVRVLTPSGVTVILPGPDSPSRARRSAGRATSASGTPRPDWNVRLRARTGDGTSAPATITLGAASGASDGYDNRWDREMPPAITPGLALEFVRPDWGRAGGRYVTDIRKAAVRASNTWSVQVTAPTDGKIVLSWDNLGTLSRRSRVTLVDKTTNERLSLRSRSSYAFESKAGQSRAFDIVVEPERTAPLALSDITVVPTRAASGGMSIGYTVSEDADVTVEVKALGGRSVRRLSSGRAEASGRQSLFWDGRDAAGSALPPGAYLMTITARGLDGALVRQIRPVSLLR